MKNLLPIGIGIIIAVVFFWQFFFKGLLPIPADTIIGLYHPFRDLYAKEYPRGITFKNFLITDPVRQQYPWKNLSIDILKRGELPSWNPYNFSGTPLLANFQSGSLYPLNLLFFLLPFSSAWSLFIVLQVILSSIFMFLFLRNLNIGKESSMLGSLCFSLSGFFIAWMEWGNVLHAALWLPLILLSIDKVFKSKVKKNKWPFFLILSLTFSLLAGHVQIFFYVLLLTITYFLFRWNETGRNRNIFKKFSIYFFLFGVISSLQWLPTLKFILESGRFEDQLNWQKEGWFIPWQNLAQFVAPDFFGNPTTLNYWGVFNYGEFIGYIGIFPLILALYSLFFKRDKIIFFFGTAFFLSLIFSLPTIFAKLPYILNIPFISSSQPTRLLLITDFSLAILASFGLDLFLKKKISILYPVGFILVLLAGFWTFTIFGQSIVSLENLSVLKRNLILPSIIFGACLLAVLIGLFYKNKKLTIVFPYLVLAIVAFDLLRFGWKFTPFTNKDFLYPKTETLSFLQNQKGNFRIMTTDSRILPPNFTVMYKLQTVDGYDPLYIRSYAELIAASERGRPDIKEPLGFNRIITPHNFESKIMDLLGVKFVLSLSDLNSPKLEKVFEEGQTQVYENKNVLPRVFFVSKVLNSKDRQDSINKLFQVSLKDTAVVENFTLKSNYGLGKAEIVKYEENKVIIKTENSNEGFLILTDTFYKNWKVLIDGKEEKILRTDYNFRGVVVPEGNHIIEFINSIL